MSAAREIEVAIQKITKTFKDDKVEMIIGTVVSIQTDNNGNPLSCTCSIQNDVQLPNILLQSSICDGLLIVPAVDSTVVIIRSTYNPPFIAQFGDIQTYYLQVGDSSFTITSDGKLAINDGSYGGLVKVVDPTDTTGNIGLLARLNKIENDINKMKGIFQSVMASVIATAAPGSPDAFQAAFNTAFLANMPLWYSNSLVKTQSTDIESAYSNHGKPAQ